MTVNDVIHGLGQHPAILVAVFAGLPVVAAVAGLIHGRGRGEVAPWKYAHAVFVYAACVPGMLAASLVLYALLFTRQSLLDVNLLVYGLPLASMVATLAVVARHAHFERLPGFERLSGLMLLLGVTFVALFLLSRTRVWVFFGGSMTWLIALAVGIFLSLQLGSRMAFGARDSTPE